MPPRVAAPSFPLSLKTIERSAPTKVHACRFVLLLLHFCTFGRRRSKAEPSRAYVLPPNRAIGLYPWRCMDGFPSWAPASSSRCGKTWNITTCGGGRSRLQLGVMLSARGGVDANTKRVSDLRRRQKIGNAFPRRVPDFSMPSDHLIPKIYQ